DHVLFWNGRDLERKLGEFQAYYNAARCHASLDGHTPLTFAGGRTVAPAHLNGCVGFPTVLILCSFRSPLDNEFETLKVCGGVAPAKITTPRAGAENKAFHQLAIGQCSCAVAKDPARTHVTDNLRLPDPIAVSARVRSAESARH